MTLLPCIGREKTLVHPFFRPSASVSCDDFD